MFFRNKDKILVEACEESSRAENLKKVFNRKFSEIFILTHPYYSSEFRFKRKNALAGYHEILSESVIRAGKKKDALAILTLEMDSKFLLDDMIFSYYCKIMELMKKSFDGRLHVRVQTGGFYGEHHKLPIVFSRPNHEITVSARGIYGDRCVMSTLGGFSQVHDIPAANCILDIDESIIAEHKIIPEERKGLIRLEEYRKERDRLYPPREKFRTFRGIF